MSSLDILAGCCSLTICWRLHENFHFEIDEHLHPVRAVHFSVQPVEEPVAVRADTTRCRPVRFLHCTGYQVLGAGGLAKGMLTLDQNCTN